MPVDVDVERTSSEYAIIRPHTPPAVAYITDTIPPSISQPLYPAIIAEVEQLNAILDGMELEGLTVIR